MRLHYISMALWLMLVLSLSARHTHGATTTPVTPSKTVSLDVQDADVRDVLRLLADTGWINILTSGEVQGTVTTCLLDVPWEQALENVERLSTDRAGRAEDGDTRPGVSGRTSRHRRPAPAPRTGRNPRGRGRRRDRG